MGRELLAGKTTLITGASSGIGAATARLFAEEGARVVMADIDVAGESIARDLGATFVTLDVTDERAWEAGIAEIDRLDVLVNNAGISLVRPIGEMTLEEWRRVLSINLDGVFLGTKHAVRKMRPNGGSIVNVSSASGIVGSPTASAYCASKGGVRLFTKSVALEVARERIRVNSVHPGAVQTPIWQRSDWWNGFAESVGGDEAAFAALEKGTPMGRMAQPSEVARAILYLASDDAAFVTGSELVIDGGFTAQ